MFGLLVGGFGSACGGDDDRQPLPAAPTPPAAVEAEPVEQEETVETRVAAMMANNDRAEFDADTRDPFSPPRPETATGRGVTETPIDCEILDQPLGRADVAELQLIGLITGTPIPRAMFLARGANQAVMVTEGDLVGPNCTNRITNIRDNEVVIEPHTVGETSTSPIIIPLNDDRLSRRFIQIEDE
jgi:Tfp pilus assembly protein PilP